MGRGGRHALERGHGFFRDEHQRIEREVARLKLKSFALGWRSAEEKARYQEELPWLEEATYEGKTADLARDLGHRYPSDLLDDDRLDDYLAWNVAKRNVRDYQWIMDHYTLLDLTLAYELGRVDHYIDLEGNDTVHQD